MFKTPYNIGNIEVKNRLIRSATFESMANEEGYVTDQHLQLYKDLAEGGVGLIITGFAYVHQNGQSVHRQLAVYDDNFVPSLMKIAEVIHNNGNNCKAILQIAHCGRQTLALENTIAPSAILEKSTEKMPREMTNGEIKEIIEAFAHAIRRGKEAGFDGVQIHGAHGWLISSFLSPYTNRRTDEYGGSTQNRIKIVEEIYNKAADLVSKNFPILIKMNGSDLLKGGLEIGEAKIIAERLAKIGFSALEISGGMWELLTLPQDELGWKPDRLPESRINIGSIHDPAYNLPLAREIKKVVNVPVILVGGINSLNLIEEILGKKSVDFIALCRPLICEPDLPNKWMKSEGEGKVECVYCNDCIDTLSEGNGLYCVIKKENK